MSLQSMAALCVFASTVPFASGAQIFAAGSPELRQQVAARVGQAYPQLEPLYKHLHAQPELSLREDKTSQRLADELEQLGFKVSRRICGHGVVGILSNGVGSTVLVRTDLDALP